MNQRAHDPTGGRTVVQSWYTASMPLSTRHGFTPSAIASIFGLFLVCTLLAQLQPSTPKLVMKGNGPTAVSRDGRYLTFINWDTGDLYVRDLKTGADRNLTKKAPAEATQTPGGGFISPDNQVIAYDWAGSTAKELRVVPVSGGPPRRIDAGAEAVWVQGWTPDSRELLIIRVKKFVGLEIPGELGFINVNNGEFRKVSEIPPAVHARLSPDGSRIILAEQSTGDPTQRDIRLIEQATGKSTILIAGPDDDYAPDWSPDSRSVFFVSNRGGRPQLWKMRLLPQPTQPEPLDDLIDGALEMIGVTATGDVLVGASDIGGSDSYVGAVDWASGRVTDVQKLINPPFKGSRRAVPSPDGTSVVFMRRDRGYAVHPGWQIPVVQSGDSGEQRVYPTALTLRDAPLWYPGNRSLLFPMPPEGALGDSIGRMWRFVRLELETGRFTEVGKTNRAGLVRMAGLTESSLYYLLGGNRIAELDWKTGTNREIYVHTDTAHQITDAAVFGHAERIAIALYGKPAVIALVTPTAKEPVRIGEIMANGRPQLAWSADGKSVLASGQLRGKQGIWRIPVDGGEPSRLELDESDINEIRISENGSKIAFTRSAGRPYELWSYRH